MISRRDWLRRAALGAAAAVTVKALPGDLLAAGLPPGDLVVYKSPTCGCCHLWEEHMQRAGFTVVSRPVNDMAPIKSSLGVPSALQSCHTAVSGRYLFEGHVPADLVQKVLREKPDILGLAVPGMPQGSPGMETGYKEAYDVVAFRRDGRTSVYARR